MPGVYIDIRYLCYRMRQNLALPFCSAPLVRHKLMAMLAMMLIVDETST